MTSVIVPVSNAGGVLTGGFLRYAGDDWDGSNILLFQYGTLVKGIGGAPDTVTPIDITGVKPVGTLYLPQRTVRAGDVGVTYPLFADFTLANGLARIVGDPTQGFFGFCPRKDITSQVPRVPEPPFGFAPDFSTAKVKIAAKLIDTATPGNLGTITRPPILVW